MTGLTETDDTDSRPPEVVSFEPIARETLSSQIRDQLLERITSGALEPGAQVPSERLLSEQFGVARTSVREAMQGLISLGVIERRGNRSYVVERLPDVRFDGTDDRKAFVRQLFETRRLLEVPIVELAARRADDEQRTEILALAEQFDPAMSVERFRELDRAFHAAIAGACRNPLLVEVYGKVMARLFRHEGVRQLLDERSSPDGGNPMVGQAAAEHARLARAVAAGDVETARREGIAHLESVERGLIDRLH